MSSIEYHFEYLLNKLIKFIEGFEGRVLIVCESDGRQSVLVDLLSSYKLNPTQCSDWIDFINQSSQLCITSASLNEGVVFKKIAISFAANFLFVNLDPNAIILALLCCLDNLVEIAL